MSANSRVLGWKLRTGGTESVNLCEESWQIKLSPAHTPKHAGRSSPFRSLLLMGCLLFASAKSCSGGRPASV
ncbi:hypothetical protein GALMADRAFT_272216 [Galerina marginata CBS 339.88]|uniref:Uncharacterized protein n=1 Tax=Galerina marginata (strain CBS 339.88) TaxID=685588 RepID=A0A067SGE9_GALM3|nr:hypothetical protein GALMADRAFT_272216 [Galerina marginata CBS 339.88]